MALDQLDSRSCLDVVCQCMHLVSFDRAQSLQIEAHRATSTVYEGQTQLPDAPCYLYYFDTDAKTFLRLLLWGFALVPRNRLVVGFLEVFVVYAM